MKITKTQLKRIIKEELKESLYDREYGDPEEDETGWREDSVTYYALINVPYELSTVISASSLEELKAEAAEMTAAEDAYVQAIFTADIIEGSL